LVDIVDENDDVVARVGRAEMRAKRLRHRSVFILVRSSDGRVLIHRRSDDKDVWPGWWDIAVGGVVTAGEEYSDAARRELCEEMGIDAAPVEVGRGSYEDEQVSLIARMYEITHDGVVAPQDGEVADFEWVSVRTLEGLLLTRKFLPDSLSLLGQRLFGE
jgi:isopentenyldiphosphate isomerase